MRIVVMLIAAMACCCSVSARCYRSSSAKHEFQREHPCPSTGRATGSCPGYIIDHVDPLCHGGADSPRNMQWQDYDSAHAKDKWERNLCAQRSRP